MIVSSQPKVNRPSSGSSCDHEKIPTLMALQPASFIRRMSSSQTWGVRIHWSGL